MAEGDIDGAMLEMQKQFNIAKNINDAGSMTGDLNLMGNILFEAGRYDEAEAKFNEALMLWKDLFWQKRLKRIPED